MKRFKEIVVLMGGPPSCSERAVSLRSGAAVSKALRARGYRVHTLDVRGLPLDLPAQAEAAFIALHGTMGEDGVIQTALEQCGLPYTGSGPAASRLCFDKIASKKRLQALGVPTPRFEVLRAGEAPSLPLPLVTKPPREGSSIGIHIVFKPAAWEQALRATLRHDDLALVEAYIPGRELTVGLVGEEVLPVVEIKPHAGYYDYKAKYTRGCTSYETPARIPSALREHLQQYALQAFRGLGCRGLGRADFRMTPSEEVFMLEINTIPGFTASSLLPKAAAAAGIDFAVLCDRILSSAALECR